MEVRNRFKGLDTIDRVPDELWMEICDIELFRNNYVTAAFNYSRDFYSFRQFETGENLYGFGLGYAYDTIVGPLKAIVHWSSMTRKVGAYLSFGFDF